MFRPTTGKFGAKKAAVAVPAAEGDAKAADGAAPAAGGETKTMSEGTGVPAWQARLIRDFADLEVPDNVTLNLNKATPNIFFFTIRPQMGYWQGGQFEFKFDVPPKYPFEGPKVTCIDKIWHPNIDLDGGVCVSVLRPWKPTYSVQVILFGLLFLFSHPNPSDPLNEEAAKAMRDDAPAFGRQVVRALQGSLTVTTKVAGETRTTVFARNKGAGPFPGLP